MPTTVSSLLRGGKLILLEVEVGSVLLATRASFPLGPSTENTCVLYKFGHFFGYGESAKKLRETGMYFTLGSEGHGLRFSSKGRKSEMQPLSLCCFLSSHAGV